MKYNEAETLMGLIFDDLSFFEIDCQINIHIQSLIIEDTGKAEVRFSWTNNNEKRVTEIDLSIDDDGYIEEDRWENGSLIRDSSWRGRVHE